MKHEKNTFVCRDSEVDETQLQHTPTDLEGFYREVLHSLEANKKLHKEKVIEGDEMALHTGAAYALEDAIKNLELIKAHFDA